MKINPIGQSDAVNRINQNKAYSSASKLAYEVSDSLELSEGAQKLSEFVNNAKKSIETSNADEDRLVADIIARMSSGSYEVSDEDVAGSIIGGVPSNI